MGVSVAAADLYLSTYFLDNCEGNPNDLTQTDYADTLMLAYDSLYGNTIMVFTGGHTSVDTLQFPLTGNLDPGTAEFVRAGFAG